MRRVILGIFALIVFGVVLALVLQNLRGIEFNYLFGTVNLPLASALVAALVIGAVIGALAILPTALAARARRRRLQKRLRSAEQEIEALRRTPVHDAR